MIRKLFFFMLLLTDLFCAVTSLAFTEMTPRTLERKLQSKIDRKQITNLWQRQLSKIDTKAYTSNDALIKMQKLAEKRKIPAYVIERGAYKYTEGNNAVYIVGKNVFMRSQPNTKARIISKLNTNFTEYLTYLGEWKHPDTGERWVCVRSSSSEVGWVYGKYVQFVSNAQFQSIVSQIKGESFNSALGTVALGNSLKIISLENHLSKTMERYFLYGLIVWSISFGVTFSILNWKINIENILKFVLFSVLTVIGAAVLYIILSLIFGAIATIFKYIAAFIGGILLLMSAGNNGCGQTECPFYPKHNCRQCNSCPHA